MLSEDQLKKIWNASQKCYEIACKVMGYSNTDSLHLMMEGKITEDELVDRRDRLDEVYREELRKLPTDILQGMLDAVQAGQQKRAQKTIDTVITELLEREL
jgi:cytochrome c-type biogenesis protein CcmH/NrfG